MPIDQSIKQTSVEILASTAFTKLSSAYRRHATGIGVAMLGMYVAVTIAMCFLKPQTDWDALAYVAVAVEGRFIDPAALHAYVYGLLESSVKPAEYALLTQGTPYRTQMFQDPLGFYSMLGMYRVKFLFVQLTAALSDIMSPLQAIRLISAASALVFVGVSLLWLRSNGTLAFAPVYAAILIVGDFSDMSRIITPDMLFSAVLLAGLYSYMRRMETLTAILLFVSFLVRPDNVIFLGAFALLMVVSRQRSWGVFAAFGVAAATLIPISVAAGQPGWWPHLYFASIEHQNTMVGFHPAFSLGLYFVAIAKQFLLAISQAWIGAGVLGLAACLVVESTRPSDQRTRLLLIAIVAGIVAKFVVFPIFDTRIYFPYVIALFLLAFRNISIGAAVDHTDTPRGETTTAATATIRSSSAASATS